MDKLRSYIHSLTDFSAESWALLQPALERRSFKKNELLLGEGEVCKSLFFIETGCCKSFYFVDGSPKNTCFFFENEVVTNIESFGSGEKSAYNLMACEPMQVVVFDKEKLFQAAAGSPEIEALGRHCIRRFATKQADLADSFRRFSAAERLSYLEHHYPEMFERIPLSQLASFLGIARETLSRIRKRRVRK